MKKALPTFIILLFFFNSEISAWNRYGLIGRKHNTAGIITLSAGPSYCFSDMHGSIFESSLITGHNYKFSLGYKQQFKNNFAVDGIFQYGNYTGNDGNYSRQYSYEANIIGFTVRGEYSINFNDITLGKLNRGRYSYLRDKPNTAYAFLGGGILSSNITKVSAIGGLNYKPQSTGLVLPFGIGYKHRFGSNLYLGAEFEWQYSFSDYLEGLHPLPPSSKNNDILGGLSITVGYKIF